MTNLDIFSLPNIDNTLDLLAEAKCFTTLDFASSYLQVNIDPASGEKTAFTTYPTLYEFNKMPFGLVNAPAIFHRLMKSVLAGLARNKCIMWFNDVLVIG